MDMKTEFYKPRKRYGHCSILVEDQLIICGGKLPGIRCPTLTRETGSHVEVFNRKEGRWQCFRTTGDPPLGIESSAVCSVGRIIYYFGGSSKDGFYNSIHSLSVDKWKWKLLFANSDADGPMRKRGCGMVSFHDSLLVVGGDGPTPKHRQPSACYENVIFDFGHVCTDEQHIYDLLADQWTTPTIYGKRFSPVRDFTLTKIATERAVMFGGSTPYLKSLYLHVVTFGQNSVQWEQLKPQVPERPRGRDCHAATALYSPFSGQSQEQILVFGGYGDMDLEPMKGNCEDCWLIEIDKATCREVKNLPSSLASKFFYSISTIAVSSSRVWLIAVGGIKHAGSEREDRDDVVLLELNLSPEGFWEIGTVLENESIYDRYKERFSLNFPSLYWRKTELQSLVKTISDGTHTHLEAQLVALLSEMQGASEVAWSELAEVKKECQELVLENRKLKQELEKTNKSMQDDSTSESGTLAETESSLGDNLDEDDLVLILPELNGVSDIEDLGLKLGLRKSTIDTIIQDYSTTEKCKREIVYYWLTRRDIIRSKQQHTPTWGELADAVQSKNPKISEMIRHKHR